MFPWQNFNNKFFVERPKVLPTILDWADAKQVDQRVWVLCAPPGAGKTWILKKLQQTWTQPGQNRLVIWLFVPDLIHKMPGSTNVWDSEATAKWIKDVHTQAKKLWPGLPDLDTNPQISVIVSKLVEMICNCDPLSPPIILVDGYDEIAEVHAEEVGFLLLDRLLDKPCTRMLIALRDEWWLRGNAVTRHARPLRLDEFEPIDCHFALQQFKAINPLIQQDACLIWMDQLKNYQWNHPFINAYLFVQSNHDGSQILEPLTQQVLEACCRDAITRPAPDGGLHHPPLEPDAWECIKNLATKLQSQWSASDLEAIGIPNVLDKRMAKLFESGLVFDQAPFYQVADGLRELLRDLYL